MQSEMDLSEQIETIVIDAKEEGRDITLFDIIKEAVPELDDVSIKQYFSYLVNGVRVTDWSIKISPSDVVKVIPDFAGGY